ncbi:bifunctional phosphoribosyl-AMP cyclohydrolase/phosphoribosyl-ATP diphosphatase HisIE [Thermoanaerobacterium thermosaccharolyticum]|uniref:bifunctional phosphoribosyl-AMP cyclohydrolase/phosphoribosyl-ATP diphosphatase HisIE n=1 Tax=Thermoanaerobacterium thermosaccharolyticum TaxID=1517 RepID=UPI003DA81B87
MNIDDLKFDEKGLIPAIVQDYKTKEVLMMAYMNRESLEKSLESKETYFFSRSRQSLWHKGETSGNVQHIKAIKYDCDGDTLLVEVEPEGPACHTGNNSCFYRDIINDYDEREEDESILSNLYRRIESRKENPVTGSYTNYLFEKGLNKILKKIGEENAEIIIASKEDSKEEVVYEIADYIYHLMVLMVEKGINLNDVYKEISKRYYKTEEFREQHKKRKETK